MTVLFLPNSIASGIPIKAITRTVKFIDRRFEQDLPAIIKVIRINSRPIRAHQPATIRSKTELRNVPANARAQRVLANIRLRHDSFLDKPRAGGHYQSESEARHH